MLRSFAFVQMFVFTPQDPCFVHRVNKGDEVILAWLFEKKQKVDLLHSRDKKRLRLLILIFSKSRLNSALTQTPLTKCYASAPFLHKQKDRVKELLTCLAKNK